MLVHLHLPKSAGTTLRMIIEREYGLDKIVQIDGIHSNSEAVNKYGLDKLNMCDVIGGHQYFGIHKLLDPECKYITMMRDPVDRVISGYSHLVDPCDRSMATFRDYTTTDLDKVGSNWQTRLLAGGELDLTLAMNNIKKHFSTIGITEMFDESVMLMKNKLSWSLNPYYVVENPGNDKVQRSDLDDSFIDKIKKNNNLDMELYSFCADKLKKDIDALGDKFKHDLDEFRETNKQSRNKIKQVFAGRYADLPANAKRNIIKCI